MLNTNRRALARWYPDLLRTAARGSRLTPTAPTRGAAPPRASLRGRRVPLSRALRAPALVVLGFDDPARLSRLLDRRPPGSTTLVIEPDAARFRRVLERRDVTGLLGRRGLKLAVGDDPLRIAAAVLALPAWAEPAVLEEGKPTEATARARRLIDGALALSRAQREGPPRELARWVRDIRRRPERLLRLPVVLTP